MPYDDEAKQEEKSIAMELLHEVKTQSKRWMVAFFTVLILWFATIGGFIWYLYQYDFSSYTAESQDGGSANIIGNDGDITNGDSEIESKETEGR